MGGSRFSGLQKLVAISAITLIALIVVSQFSTFKHSDADGTATGSAVNTGIYSGNGGSVRSRLVKTDEHGAFSTSLPASGNGPWTVRGLWAGSTQLARASTPPVQVSP